MTDYLLRVALWQIPTMVIASNKPQPERTASMLTMNALNTLDAQERFRALETQVGLAATAFARQAPQAGQRVLDVFVAPEYLFARSDAEHFQTEATKDLLCGSLKALSERHPSVLLIPGTIAWAQPGLRSNFVASLFKRDRGKRALSNRKKATGIQDSETAALKTARGDGAAYMLGRNTVYVYRAGKRILKYDKRDDGAEVTGADGNRVFFAPGDRDGYFTVDGVDFSLQICAEHGHPPAKVADAQLVISSSHPLRTQNGKVRADGYLMHADAVLAPKVMRFANAAWTEVTAQSTATGSPLTAAEIADRSQRAQAAMPAKINTAKGDRTVEDAVARRMATESTQLGGRVHYYALTYQK